MIQILGSWAVGSGEWGAIERGDGYAEMAMMQKSGFGCAFRCVCRDSWHGGCCITS